MTSRGQALAFDAPRLDLKSSPAKGAVIEGLAAAPDAGGFYLAASDGDLYAYGDAVPGATTSVPLTDVVGISST